MKWLQRWLLRISISILVVAGAGESLNSFQRFSNIMPLPKRESCFACAQYSNTPHIRRHSRDSQTLCRYQIVYSKWLGANFREYFNSIRVVAVAEEAPTHSRDSQTSYCYQIDSMKWMLPLTFENFCQHPRCRCRWRGTLSCEWSCIRLSTTGPLKRLLWAGLLFFSTTLHARQAQLQAHYTHISTHTTTLYTTQAQSHNTSTIAFCNCACVVWSVVVCVVICV